MLFCLPDNENFTYDLYGQIYAYLAKNLAVRLDWPEYKVYELVTSMRVSINPKIIKTLVFEDIVVFLNCSIDFIANLYLAILKAAPPESNPYKILENLFSDEEIRID